MRAPARRPVRARSRHLDRKEARKRQRAHGEDAQGDAPRPHAGAERERPGGQREVARLRVREVEPREDGGHRDDDRGREATVDGDAGEEDERHGQEPAVHARVPEERVDAEERPVGVRRLDPGVPEHAMDGLLPEADGREDERQRHLRDERRPQARRAPAELGHPDRHEAERQVEEQHVHGALVRVDRPEERDGRERQEARRAREPPGRPAGGCPRRAGRRTASPVPRPRGRRTAAAGAGRRLRRCGSGSGRGPRRRRRRRTPTACGGRRPPRRQGPRRRRPGRPRRRRDGSRAASRPGGSTSRAARRRATGCRPPTPGRRSGGRPGGRSRAARTGRPQPGWPRWSHWSQARTCAILGAGPARPGAYRLSHGLEGVDAGGAGDEEAAGAAITVEYLPSVNCHTWRP